MFFIVACGRLACKLCFARNGLGVVMLFAA